MGKSKIDCFRFRYIVPFSFDRNGESFENCCNRVESAPDWSEMPESKSESDVYEYVKSAFVNKDNKSNVGRAFTYNKRDDKGRILRIAYCDEITDKKAEVAKTDKYTAIDIVEAGMYLFRTGIGLFWYEIGIGKKDISVDWLINFQYKFKELNSDIFYQVVRESVLEGTEFSEYDVAMGSVTTVGNKGEFSKFTACAVFSVGNWISDIVGDVITDVVYYPERNNIMAKTESKVNKAKHPIVPDKAILFSYVVMNVAKDDNDSLVNTAYYLANGYKESYLMVPEMEAQMYKPFKDAYWYATKEGCGYFVKSDKANEKFFTGNMKSKVISDYFSMYILLLHQSYTLLHFTGRIEEGLSADAKDYQDSSARFADSLESIKTDINVFLVKSVYASVSHVQHQNGFYEYVEKQLRIKENIKSITMGLEALADLQNIRLKDKEEKERERLEREKELSEEKKQLENDALSIGLSVISLFAIFSAFADGVAVIDRLMEINNFSLLNDYSVIIYGIVIVLITGISVYTVVRLIQAAYRSHKSKKDLKKKEEEIKNEIH